MKLDIKDIAKAAGADTSCLADATITTLLTDSRSLSAPVDSTLFFALRTAANDGHRYIGQLYDKGVRNFVVSHRPDNADTLFSDANFIVAADPLAVLHKLAAANRRASGAEVVAIAGSRGKTFVKEWLFQALGASGRRIARSPRSFNSQIGTALSLMEIASDTDLAIIEAGISQPGEMERLEHMIAPTIGIFTNLLADHAEGFPGGDPQKCAEKALLFKGCRCIVFNADCPIAAEALAKAAAPGCELIGWSLTGSPEARIRFSSATDGEGRSRFGLTMPDGSSTSVTLPYTAAHDIENICHVAAALIALGLGCEAVAYALRRLTPVATRTEVAEGQHGSSVIHDRYTADLVSLDMALDFMARRMPGSSRAAAVLGDLTADPEFDTPSFYTRLGDMLRRRGVTTVVTAGKQLRDAAPLWNADGFFRTELYGNTQELLDNLDTSIFEGIPVIVKGPWGSGLDRVARHLEARRHETVLDVNLDALVGNFNFYRSRLRPETGIVCMVKAFGYGAGSYELAKTLQAQGAAYLAVAVLDEGIELRDAGITMPIMVMNPRVVDYAEMFDNRLEPEVFSFDMLDEIIRHAESHGVTDYPVHIKFDTGMHRLGFIGDDLERLAATLSSTRAVTPSSMFSHLAAADEPALDSYTQQQFDRFEKWCDELQSHFPFRIRRHILNSTGITRFPERQYDMVRLGICLYGVPTMADGSQNGLRHVSSLRTTVISIKEWPAGTTIGYNCRGVCAAPSRIATIPIGYADGIDRHLGNGGMHVWINGHRCPTIGNICMDACMIDVSGCGDDCRVGDSVEIFGDHVDIAELSSAIDTIPYEILTSVSMRVKRVYYRE